MCKLISEKTFGTIFRVGEILSKPWLPGVLKGPLYFLLQILKFIYTEGDWLTIA